MMIWDIAMLSQLEVNRIGSWTASFDGGTKKTYESIRKNSNFEKVIENIRKLCEYRYERSKELKENYWIIKVPSILMTSNYQEMDATFRLFQSLPVELNFVPIARDYRPEAFEQVFDTKPKQQELLAKLNELKRLVEERLENLDSWEYEIPLNHYFSSAENRRVKLELTKNTLASVESCRTYLLHIMENEGYRGFERPRFDYEVAQEGSVVEKELLGYSV
jgi:MoaA/NifB/PqqE/SkfB family radical SAM enzyme